MMASQAPEHLVVDTNLNNGDASRLEVAPGVARCPSVAFDKTVDDTLKLDTHDLILEDKNLIVIDREARKKQRICFPPSDPGRLTIPLHNILWASHDDDLTLLTIAYAVPISKSRLRPAALTIPLTNSTDLPGAIPTWTSALLSRAYGPAPRRRRAYVLVNPKAGPGGAVKKFETQVRPIFEAANMQLDVVTTTYSGEGADLAEKLDISKYDVVVVCSGDGMPHEVINGFGRRPAARTVLSTIAVAHIPCGSGNGMALNLYGTSSPSRAALGIVKGVVTTMDLMSVTQGPRRYLSFLSQAVGIVAEADLATEHLRWMGGARFTWGFLERFLAKKCFPCDVAVKVEIETKEGVRAHFARQRRGRDAAEAAVNRSTSVGAASETAAGVIDEELPPLKYGTINDKLPDGWELIPYNNMGNFYCGNMGWMASDANFFPGALINDGLMDLLTVNGDIPVAKSVQVMTGLGTGTFFDHPLVSYRKVSAFRIIPRDQKDGYISIDGERVPFEPFQVEVHKGLLRVISSMEEYIQPGPQGWEKLTGNGTA